jgi:PAS domain S-box-containing protein
VAVDQPVERSRPPRPELVSEVARNLLASHDASSAAQYLAAIVESSDDAIISKTLDGVIVSWNSGAERLYGYPAAEVVGRPIALLIPPDQPDELPAIMARLRRGERVDHYETRRLRKDGTRIDVSLTVSPVRDVHGVIVGASAIARDISERRRIEEEHARLLEVERTAQVAAQQARQKAEEATRAKDEFLAMVSHELRTPLHAVAGWLHVLRSKRDDPALVERALETANRNIRLLAKVVDDLLDVSRIVAGQVAISRVPTDIPPILEAALCSLQPVALEKGVKMASVVDPWAGPVLGDPERLQQVVGNIVSNAIKFTPPGGRVDVRARHDATHVEIVVRDTGEGIPPDFLPHVFDAFR